MRRQTCTLPFLTPKYFESTKLGRKIKVKSAHFYIPFTEELHNAMVTCEIKLFRPLLMSIWNNFISVRGNLPEIISTLFQKLVAAQGYFPCSVSLKYFWNNFRGRNNFVSVSDVATCEIEIFWNNFEIMSVFYFTCNHSWICITVWNCLILTQDLTSSFHVLGHFL